MDRLGQPDRPMVIKKARAWNGHFDCTCYHKTVGRTFLFNQFGKVLEKKTSAPCRDGNVHI